jgi:hypothetical protein
MGFDSLFEGVKLNMLSSPGGMSSDDAESVLTLFVDSLMHVARLQGAGKSIRGDGELKELPVSRRAATGTE